MEGKSRIAISEIVKVLMEQGAVKSKTTAYSLVEKETAGFGRIVEDGQKFWVGDFSRLFDWLKSKLGEKEVVREIVEQGIPFKEYQKALEEIRKLEREVAQKEAEVKIREREIKSLEEKVKELLEEKVRLASELETRERAIEEEKKKVKELERKFRLKELEDVIKELPEEKRRELLKTFEKVINP